VFYGDAVCVETVYFRKPRSFALWRVPKVCEMAPAAGPHLIIAV